METRKRKMNNNANNEEKTPIEAKVMHLQKSVDDIQKSQDEKDLENKKILEELRKSQKEQDEKNEKVLEELKNQQKLILEELRKSKEELKVEKSPSFNSVISSGFLMKNTPNNGSSKSFVLKHKFNDVSKFAEDQDNCSDTVMHFGVPWSIMVAKKEQYLGFWLCCEKKYTGNWSIEAEFTLKTVSGNGRRLSRKYTDSFGTTEFHAFGADYFNTWDCILNHWLVDDAMDVKVYVKIKKIHGIYDKKNSRCFDESMKELSDVVLVVGEQKFYVAKLYLATHSSYFKTLFLGQFQESNKSEIELTGIEARDFQNFLEVLYGDPSIEEITVDGILVLADMYDTPTIVKKCEDFLLDKSKKSTKEKLQMAIRFNLDKLKEKCMSEIKTVADIKSMIPGNPADLDNSIWAELLEKAISFQS